MTLTTHTRLAAWACIISAVLGIPYMLLSFIDNIIASLFMDILITPISAYIFIVLKNYLHSTKTTWVIWSIISLSILYLVFSLVMLFFPDMASLIMVVELLLIIPMGILFIILGVMIINLETLEAQSLKSFAIVSILIGVAIISVLLVFTLPLLSIISDIILARVFFQANKKGNKIIVFEDAHSLHLEHNHKQSPAQKITSSHITGTENSIQLSTWIASLVIIVIWTSLLITVYQLLSLYHLYEISLPGHDKKLILSEAIINVIKVVLLLWLFKSCHELKEIYYCLKFLLFIYILAIIHSVYLFNTAYLSGALAWFSMDFWLENASRFIIHYLLAFIYFRIALLVWKSSWTLNGFKYALSAGLFAYAFFLLVYFYDTLKLSAYIFIDFVLLGLFISFYFSRININLENNKNLQHALVSIFLFGPVLLFVGSFLIKSVNFIAQNSDRIAEAGSDILTETTKITELESTQDRLNDYEKITSRPVFSNAWLFSDKHWLAINQSHLYKTQDAGKHWQQIKKLEAYGEEIHFDRSAKRGWLGDRLNGIEVTEDGGKTWRSVEHNTIYHQVLGKKYRDSITANWSDMHLDPDTGKGAFTLKCKYFYTEDFAQSWKNLTIKDKEGKELCLYESAFAINEDKTLAMTGNILLYYLYRKKPGANYWQQVCNLEDGLFQDSCSDNATLTEKEKLYIQHYKNDDAYFSKAAIEYDELQQILTDAYFPVEELTGRTQQSDEMHWYSGYPGIIFTLDKGEQWQSIQELRDFSFIIPVDETHAYAWQEDTGVFYTADGAYTWQPVHPELANEPLHSLYLDKTKKLWTISNRQLRSIDVITGKISQQLDVTKENYNKIASSDNGKALWLYRAGEQKASISFDSGENWYGYNTYPAMKDKNNDWAFLSIEQLICDDTTSSCFIVLSDRSVIKVLLNNNEFVIAPDKRFVLPIVDDEYLDEPPGWLAISWQENMMIYFANVASRYVYISNDRGSSWDKVSVKSSRYWRNVQQRNNGRSILAHAQDMSIISHDAGRSWRRIKANEDSYFRDFCWDETGRTLVMSDSDTLVITLDGAQSWQSMEQHYPVRPGCAIGNDYLWLINDSITVFKKTSGEIKDENSL